MLTDRAYIGVLSGENVVSTGCICQPEPGSCSPWRLTFASVATLVGTLRAYPGVCVLRVAKMTPVANSHTNRSLNSLYLFPHGPRPLRFYEFDAIFGREVSTSFETVTELSPWPCGLPIALVDVIGLPCCVSAIGRHRCWRRASPSG